MKRNHRRIALYRRRRIHPSSFPYVRYSKLLPLGNIVSAPPCLRLYGEWLHEAGFLAHWRVKVTVRPGMLVIEPVCEVLHLPDAGKAVPTT